MDRDRQRTNTHPHTHTHTHQHRYTQIQREPHTGMQTVQKRGERRVLHLRAVTASVGVCTLRRIDSALAPVTTNRNRQMEIDGDRKRGEKVWLESHEYVGR